MITKTLLTMDTAGKPIEHEKCKNSRQFSQQQIGTTSREYILELS